MDTCSWKKEWVDYYQLLEVDRSATEEEIKKAYRNLMKKYHPDIYKGDDALEISQMLNDAYATLSKESEKKEYDKAWDYKKENPNQSGPWEQNENTQGPYEEADAEEAYQYEYDDIDYEDVKNNYTKQEQRYAEKMALTEIINEELAKIENIIVAKNNLIYMAYKGQLEPTDYYLKVKELVNIGNEFIKKLQLLIEKAYDYYMFEEQERILESISFLEEQLNSIPTASIDAKYSLEEEVYKNKLMDEIGLEFNKAEDIKGQFNALCVALYQKDISHLDYPIYLQKLTLEGKATISILNELNKILCKLDMQEETKKINEEIAKITSLIKTTPIDIKKAEIIGKEHIIKEKVRAALYEKQVIDELNMLQNNLNNETDPEKREKLYSEILQFIDREVNYLNGLLKDVNELSAVPKSDFDIAKEFSDEAIALYEKAKKLEVRADKIYEKETKTEKDILILSKEGYTCWDKSKALELLNNASQLVKSVTIAKGQPVEMEKLGSDIKIQIGNIEAIRNTISKDYNKNHKDFKVNKNSPYMSAKDYDYLRKQYNEMLGIEILTIVIAAAISFASGWGTYALLANDDKNFLHYIGAFFTGCFTFGGLKHIKTRIESIKKIIGQKAQLKQQFLFQQNLGTSYQKTKP